VTALFVGAVAWASQGNPDDVKALDANVEAWVAAFNAHDAKALAATYAEDADSLLSTGERLKGRAAIEKSWAEFFAKNPKVKTKPTVISRRFLKPDVVVDGEWEEWGHTQEGLPTKGLYTAVLVKQRGTWLALCERGTGVGSEAGAASAAEAILKMEHELNDAYVRGVATVERILADDYVIVIDDEVRSKADEVGDLRTGALRITELTLEYMKVRVYGNTAVVNGIFDMKGTFRGKDHSGRYRFTDVVVHREKAWRMVSTHASKVPGKK
jgi:uncharacterized protein (TIGR02246 family)